MLHELPEQAKDARAAAIPPILLPHSGEMASLLGCEPEDVEADPLAAGTTCANRYGSVVLVKGVQSHIVTPDGQSWKYSGGAPGLGVSGSGDVLAGIVGGLLARGASPLTAVLWAVWLHGEAGRTLSKSVGEVGFLAREIPDCVPRLLSIAVR
jgi:NAD(P)H-hydrate repair Nnr-like enzyme with NAD(P)H-hydrate dehydratase domain